MRKVARNLLQLLGAKRIVECLDGNEAFAHLEGGGFDIVLSEWYLLGSRGIDLVYWLRQLQTDTRYTPFIMVTSQTRVENIVIARNLGITEFVAKPFSAHSLISRIREIVERPRPFVQTRKYFGPDRRRRATDVSSTNNRRRNPSPLTLGKDLTQDQINDMVSGGSRRQ
jgi:two-component system chemotaxis response regulator CheY